jgi:superfamily II DNA or RNA helicase
MRRGMRIDWDQGTLVVQGEAEGLPGCCWDPRVGLWRAPAFRRAELLAALATRGLQAEERDLQLLPGTGPVEVPELRPYQEAALVAWEIAGRRGLIALPTGAGKTRTAIAALTRLRQPALILVPTRILLEQWAAALLEAGLPVVGRHGDGERSLEPVTVCTFASAQRHMAELGRRFGLLIVDEAHHYGGRMGETLEMCAAPFRLGLTATPPAGPALDLLGLLIGPLAYRIAVEQLAGEYLAPFRLITLSLALSPEEKQEWEAECAAWKPVVRAFFAQMPEGSWPDLVRVASRSEEGRRALRAWRRSRALLRHTRAAAALLGRLLARHAHSRSLIFAPDAETAVAISRQQLIPAITAEIGRAERRELLEAFAAGRRPALVSAFVLNEGVDVPAAEVAILLGGGQSDRTYVQRVGRVLRPSPGKEALIYELIVQGCGDDLRVERRRRALAAP